MGVEFELGSYPIIVVRFPRVGTEAAVHAWYDEVERLLEEADEPLAFIDDLRRVDVAASSTAQRRLIAARSERLTARYASKHAGNARIAPNPLLVAAIRIVDWLSPLPWPSAVFDNEEDARAWCAGRIAASRALNG